MNSCQPGSAESSSPSCYAGLQSSDMQPSQLPNLINSWQLRRIQPLESFPLALDHRPGRPPPQIIPCSRRLLRHQRHQRANIKSTRNATTSASTHRHSGHAAAWEADPGQAVAPAPTFVSLQPSSHFSAIARKPSINLILCHNGARRPEVHFVARLKHIVCSLLFGREASGLA